VFRKNCEQFTTTPIYYAVHSVVVKNEMLETLTYTLMGVGLCASPFAFLEYVHTRVKKAETQARRQTEQNDNWKNQF
jgi:hypothetical protein